MLEVIENEFDLAMIVELIDERAKYPVYSDPEDAGMDVFACLHDDNGRPIGSTTILPGDTVKIPLGLKVGLPKGWFLSVNPRSGLSYNTLLRVSNAPGTIDTNYKGELSVLLFNASTPRLGERMGAPHPITTCYNMQGIYEIKTGDKIAQLIPKRRHKALIVTGKATDIGEDRGGGFGHSGV